MMELKNIHAMRLSLISFDRVLSLNCIWDQMILKCEIKPRKISEMLAGCLLVYRTYKTVLIGYGIIVNMILPSKASKRRWRPITKV